MKVIENWGSLLKGLIKQSGIEQKDVAESLGMSSQLYSTKLKDADVKIKTVLGTLDFLKVDLMTVLHDPDEIGNYLPDYISVEWAEILKTLHTEIDESKRQKIKNLFVSLLDTIVQ